jgi:hypothetical protein
MSKPQTPKLSLGSPGALQFLMSPNDVNTDRSSRTKMQNQNSVKEETEKSDLDNGDIDDEELEVIYSWVDAVTINRPKRNIQRDFADGSLLAHIIHHYLPKSQKSIV